MSDLERSTSPNKPGVKPKPELRPRLVVQGNSPPPSSSSSSSSPPDQSNGLGASEKKVKEMVNIFSKQESKELEEQMTNGHTELLSVNKKPPVVKPKPDRSSLQAQVKSEPLPPLPKKRSRFINKSKKSVEGEEAEGMSVEGGRSAPDGKEVEAQVTGGDEKERDHDLEMPLSLCCDTSCSCLCHLHRPGMMLIWVPVDVETSGAQNDIKEQTPKDDQICNKDEEVDQGGKEGSEAKEDVDSAPVEEKQVLKQIKPNVLQCLEGLFAEQKKISDQGPPPGTSNHRHLSSVPPKPAPSSPVHELPSQDEEESIYELTLPGAPPASKTALLVKDLDFLRLKPISQSKSPSITLDSQPSVVDVPPAIPPKIPITAETALPLRPPPPPPKKDARRPSNVSMESLKTGEKERNGDKDSREPSPIRRKSSFNLQTHLQNEPLYQVYRKTVITKEIRRQTVSRNISKTSDDFPAEWAARRKGSEPSTLSRESKGNTLWQELPKVQDSGVLKQLTTDQLKYQESMFEVLTSEASYLRSLRILTEHFLDSRDLKETMIIRDRKTLFSNILRIREVSERFCKDLEERIFKDIVFPDICDIIHYHAQHNFPAYIDYVRNQIYQEKTFTTLKKNNAQFATVISHLQESPQCQRLPFISFLLLPFQRITRIKMLIENILKRTKEGTKEEETAIKALDSVSKIIDKCNTEVGKMRQMEELIQVSGTMEFDSKLKAIPIISETRYLEKKGELQEMSRGKTLVNMRGRFSPIHLFLFNDLLIVAVKKGAERFMVVDYSHRSLVQVQLLDEASSVSYENCFNLIILENHQGRTMERLLKASSRSDMHRWLAAFPESTNQDEEEKIYEDNDCPQVQCVEQYIAEQADELSLEPAEIVNVIRKTNEGWYEGMRLSDGQKGWFPVANVIEITNDHVRRKNILERYRVTRAASMLTESKFV